ncbi:Amine sulfotransferase, partial [Anas platyrhynchos]
RLTMEPSKEFVFKYKGFYFGVNTSVEHVASLENFEIKDSDIFIATYPKSGTVWTQNILSLILHEGHRNGTENMDIMDRIPWLEYNIKNIDFTSLPVPRRKEDLKCPAKNGKIDQNHTGYTCQKTYCDFRKIFVPVVLQIIYVTRNPKDVLVSYYHFSKFIITLEEVPDFNIFMERFLAGKVLASSWFDHVAGWYGHAEDFNILFLTYEEMKKDLRSAVLKICNFLGKKLSEEEIESVVRQATFENMKKDPRANYENLPDDIADKNKGRFLRKG